MSNPYLDARREWNERYGSYISSLKVWRFIAFFALLLAAVSVFGAMWLASQTKIIPYVVEVEKGEVVEVYPARQGEMSNELVIKSQIARFIKDVRAVSSDRVDQSDAIKRAYSHLNDTLPAYRAVNQWFRNNVPFKRAAEDGTVTVTVKQMLPLSKNTWRVEWEELPREKDGVAGKAIDMVGTIKIRQGGDVTNQTLQNNPIGLMIEEFEWSKEFNN